MDDQSELYKSMCHFGHSRVQSDNAVIQCYIFNSTFEQT
jgi:hypothetical protein